MVRNGGVRVAATRCVCSHRRGRHVRVHGDLWCTNRRCSCTRYRRAVTWEPDRPDRPDRVVIPIRGLKAGIEVVPSLWTFLCVVSAVLVALTAALILLVVHTVKAANTPKGSWQWNHTRTDQDYLR